MELTRVDYIGLTKEERADVISDYLIKPLTRKDLDEDFAGARISP